MILWQDMANCIYYFEGIVCEKQSSVFLIFVFTRHFLWSF